MSLMPAAACWTLVTVIAAGCQREIDQGPAIQPAAEPAWRAKLIAERAENDHALKTDISSPLAGIDRFTPDAASYVTVDTTGLRLEAQAGAATRVSFQPAAAAQWSWRPAAPEVTATTLDGARPLEPGAIEEPMLIRLTPRYAMKAQFVNTALVLTAYDAERPQVTAFHALSYFAPDARFVVHAVLDRLATAAPIELATSRGLTKPFVHIGTLRFGLGGARLSLEAYRPADSTGRDLFVPFRDATSGNASYGAARFLDLEAPADPASPVEIDFNRAYNPLCAYSPAFNCPLPPPENVLATAITAGERDPRMH